ncbi:hypothetical protein [Burkholderia gladioli]|uniref:hypothetical protein n=1 Tax=Burkholderia gladioli TaxID=28095 RepID=UPI00163EA1E0|nr:hypothetical protein [Burkholderia gladioli]MBJ9673209.1 hypothetical protein [Burkholderia gladioli]MDN7460056.1 hypothetical protein [Burkholderia gladioli]
MGEELQDFIPATGLARKTIVDGFGSAIEVAAEISIKMEGNHMLELNLDYSEKVVSVVAGLVAIVGAAGTVAWKLLNRSDDVSAPPSQSLNATVGNQTVTVNVGEKPNTPVAAGPLGENEKHTVSELKRVSNILFIDDDRGFKIVGILKKMGWEHTRLVTDITSLEQQYLLDAHVVFVDIQGVGRSMQYTDEGLGLALAIKRRYPEKRVVIYSAEEKGARFHEALQEADYSLSKTAEPIRFEDTIVRVLKK